MSWQTTVRRAFGRSIILADNVLRPVERTSPKDVKSILILEYLLPLGCCVHLTPLYEALKLSRPDLVLTVATRGLAAALLRHNPNIDHLIETPDALTETLTSARVLRAELHRRNLTPQLTLTGSSDRRTRIALLAILASRGKRAGYTLFPELYHAAYLYDPTQSLLDNNLRLAAEAGCSPAHREPIVFFSRTDLATARILAAEMNPTGKPLLIMVTQPSGGQSTSWHQERFAEVAVHAADLLGCAVAFVGTKQDAAPIEALRTATAARGINLAGMTSVTELAALLSISDYLVSLDTGTVHLARAVELPLVVLGPCWQRPLEWLPIENPNARIVRGEDCTVIPPNYKLDEITVVEVIAALKGLMTSHPASELARAERVARSLSDVDHQLS